MTSIGFTGTRLGMSPNQKEWLREYLTKHPCEFHHGDCIGSDEQAHIIAKNADCEIHIHPPIDDIFRAYCAGGTIHPKKEYLERNRDIVDSCHILIACPRSHIEEQCSGTWATVRYARKIGRSINIIYPE